ncbi:MAG: hypothetical protein J6P60_07080 [Lachnospiraceae bacterium]|nr:hypothetical protein [Lachnospiraceae bacterium]
MTDEKLVVFEKAAEVFDEDGNATYYYSSDDGGDESEIDQSQAQSLYDSLVNEFLNAEIIEFTTVVK